MYSQEEIQAELVRREVQRRGLVDPQAVPDDQAVSESQFQTEEQMRAPEALETTELLGSPKDPNFDKSGLEPWQYEGGLTAGSQRNPNFLKTLDMLNTGVHRGVTNFTLGVMSMIPGGKDYQNAIKKYDADIEAEQQKNLKTYDSWSPQIGELGGELLVTAPAGGLLAKIGAKALGLIKGDAALSSSGLIGSQVNKVVPFLTDKALPQGTKLLGGYGTSALGGAGVLSGISALRYQGDEFDPAIAAQTFKKGMSDPLSYALPVAGTALSRYVEKANRLVKETGSSGLPLVPRDLLEKGSWKTMVNMALDSFSTLVPLGERAKQLQDLVPAIGQVIRKIAGNTAGKSTDELIDYAGKNLQMGLKKLEIQRNLAWDKGFKDALVTNTDELLPYINAAKEEISSVSLPTYNRAIKLIDKSLEDMSKGKVTFEKIKEIGTVLGDAAQDAYKLEGSGITVGKTLSNIRKDLLETASGNLSKEQMFDWKTAQTLSKNQYELEDALPQVKNAIKRQVESNKIVEGILKDSTNFDKDLAMGLMSKKGQLATKAAKISDALSRASSEAGQLNLDMFLKNVTVPETIEATTRAASATKNLLGPEYKYIEGMTRHLKAINEAKKIGNVGKYVVPLVGTGVLTGLGATGNLDADSFKAVAPYAAVLFASNHPVLKRLLGATTKKLSPSTFNHLNSKIQDIFTRAGYFYNDDGSMNKGEDK